MVRWCVVVWLLAACGRVDFDALANAGITPERGSLLVTASLTQSFASMAPAYQPLVCMTSSAPTATCISRETFADRTTLSIDNATIATGGAWVGSERRTIIGAWDETSASLHEPGQSDTVGLGTPLPVFDGILLGANPSEALDGCIERLAYWSFALTAAELAAAGVE